MDRGFNVGGGQGLGLEGGGGVIGGEVVRCTKRSLSWGGGWGRTEGVDECT